MSLLDSGLVDEVAPASAGPALVPPTPPASGAGTSSPAKPAKKPAKKAPAAKKGPGRPARNNLARRLEQSIASLGVGVAILSPPDGAVILDGAEGVAVSLDRLAAENPKVQATLERWLTAGAWSGVVMATLPIAVGIAANHGLVPEVVAEVFTALAADEAEPDGDT